MKRFNTTLVIFLLGLAPITRLHAGELVSLWSLTTADGRAFQMCIDKDKIPKLRTIDILNENPGLSLREVARVAVAESKKRNPKLGDVRITIADITFKAESIGDAKFSHYEVEVVMKHNGTEVAREWISILLDGEVLQRIPVEKWRELEGAKSRKVEKSAPE